MEPQTNSFVSIDQAIDDHLKGQQEAPAPAEPAPVSSEAPAPEQAGAEVQSADVAPEQAPPAPSETPDTGEPDVLTSDDLDLSQVDLPATVTVPVDGTEKEISLDELRRGWMQQADYTRKTQALAEERRQFEAESKNITAQQQQYVQGLQQMAQALSAQEPPEPDPTLREVDPIAYLEQQEERRQHRERMEGLNRAYQEEMQKQQEQQKKMLDEAVANSEKALIAAIPELQDDSKKRAFIQRNREYMVRQGFTENEVNAVFDHRALIQIDKARRYDEAVAKAAARKAGGGSAPSTPSINQSQTAATPVDTAASAVKQAEERLSSSGNMNDAVDLLLARRDAAQAQ